MNKSKRVCWVENHLCNIPLPNGEIAICDEHFYDKVKGISWSLKSNGYVHARKQRKDMTLHRFLYPELKMIDHINHNKLDNRSCNLRECNHSANKMNRLKQANNTSGYKGVYFSPISKTFSATVTHGETCLRRFGFKTAVDAANAYNEMALSLGCVFVCLNNVGS